MKNATGKVGLYFLFAFRKKLKQANFCLRQMWEKKNVEVMPTDFISMLETKYVL